MVIHVLERIVTARAVALGALGVVVALAGCDKGDQGSAESAGPKTVQYDAALVELAGAVERYHHTHGQLPETSAPVYCRGGRSVIEQDALLGETLGYEMPGDFKGVDLCFNVSDDRTRVALSAREKPTDATARCLVLDVSGEQPVRSEITDAERCLP